MKVYFANSAEDANKSNEFLTFPLFAQIPQESLRFFCYARPYFLTYPNRP
ncbi:hypothetical protein NT05HA_2081 [Aggregatibacter aphrophilus NJ8700]|nr:hypothetical protein NT05HA_2081 [Aggregatibacter aphrophilus NJ8700]